MELGQRVMWALMTLADYHTERARVRRWHYEGSPLPSKWEKGVDPPPQRPIAYTIKSVGTFPMQFRSWTE
jgi:hypothetical protein